MPNYAIIDVGSNTVRLVVYAVPDDAKTHYVRSDFSTIVNDKMVAGLAAYIEDGAFTEAGIEKAASTINAHLVHAAYFDCKRVSVFATAVIRNATNSADAVSSIEARIARPLDVITGADEAHLGFVGAKSATHITDGVMLDIGGGSTELTVVRNGVAGACDSIPQGSLSSYSTMVRFVTPSADELSAIRAAFSRNLNAHIDPTEYRTPILYGVGGSIRAAAKMLTVASGQPVRPQSLTRDDVENILHLCESDPSMFAHTALKAGPERIHTLVPGCAILAQTMKELDAHGVIVCRCGIREGYLIERVLEAEVGTPLGASSPLNGSANVSVSNQ